VIRAVPTMPDSREKAILQSLLRWYRTHYRALPWRRAPGRSLASPPSPYRIWLAEIMAQQTTVQAAAPYYRTFVRRWPSIQHLARARKEDVLAAWAGLGYYRRAHNLYACAQEIAERHGGRFPRQQAQLLRLPGIGPYTAAALGAVAFNQRTAPLDTHITRVVARLYALRGTPKTIASAAASLFAALGARQHAGDAAQAFMDLGAQLCHWRAPNCAACPLSRHCRAFQRGTIAHCPPRPMRRARKKLYATVFWLQRADGKVLLRRRANEGILGGMLEFPSSPWQEARAARVRLEMEDWPEDWPAAKHWRRSKIAVRHVFTHFELELQLRWMRLTHNAPHPQSEQVVWLAAADLPRAALPSLMRKVDAAARAAVSAPRRAR